MAAELLEFLCNVEGGRDEGCIVLLVVTLHAVSLVCGFDRFVKSIVTTILDLNAITTLEQFRNAKFEDLCWPATCPGMHVAC